MIRVSAVDDRARRRATVPCVRSNTGMATSGSPGADALQQHFEARHVEGERRTLARPLAAGVQHDVVDSGNRPSARRWPRSRQQQVLGSDLPPASICPTRGAGDGDDDSGWRPPACLEQIGRQRRRVSVTRPVASLGRLLGAGHEGHRIRHRVFLGIDDAEPPARGGGCGCGRPPRRHAACCARSARSAGRAACTSRISSSTRRDSLTPSAAVGSSMMMTLEPKAAARATATPWRWPPESVSTAWLMFWMVIRPSSESLCAGALLHGRAVEHAEPAAPSRPRLADLAAEEHVVGDRQRRRQREVLVDRLDAGLARLHRRVEVERPCLRA